MCSRVTCNDCNKPTWAGCGRHIEQALSAEAALIEQVLVALFDPQHDLAEVMQVVERVVDGMGDHGRKSDGGNRHCLYIQIPLHDKRRGSRHNQPRVQGLHCSPRSVHACSVAPAIPPASTLALPMGA